MIKRYFLYLFLIIFIASCGSQQVADFSGDSSQKKSSQNVTLQSILSEMGKARYVEGEILVKFRSGVLTTQSLKVHQGIGARSLRVFTTIPGLEHVKLPEGLSVRDAIVRYMSDPAVEYAEPNYFVKMDAIPNDTYFNRQWSLYNTGTFAGGTAGADIKAVEAWDIKTGDSGIVVAILDTGIDYTHEDLINNIWRNPGESSCNDGVDSDGNGYIDDCIGWDFTTCSQFNPDPPYNCITPKPRDNDPMDDNGHGTHVAGIIGARGNNARGIAGVMWNVKLMPLKVLNMSGEGAYADLIAGIDYAVTMKWRGVNIKVLNASLGGYAFSQALYEAIDRARNADILFVAAAGNDGVNTDMEPHYPASFNLPNIISVAATDQNDRRASFSNFGTNTVHVGAPGVYILSTVPNNGYEEMEFLLGTSMATPHVSGIAGLLSSYYTNFNYYQIRQTIFRYVDVKDPSFGLSGWVATGGRVNAYRALSSLLIPTGLTATAKSSREITLSWADNATGEDGYRVERKTYGDDYRVIATLSPNSTSYTDSGLSASTTYFYRVIAFNNIGESPSYSNEASATTPATDQPSGGGGGCSVGAGRVNNGVDIAFLLILVIVIVAFSRKIS